jgi:hypothetical protein
MPDSHSTLNVAPGVARPSKTDQELRLLSPEFLIRMRATIQPRRCSKLRPVAKSSPHRNARRTQREITWYQGVASRLTRAERG